MTSSIQPPTLAWAWRIALGDPAAMPAIVRHHDWLSENRDLDGDGLIWLVQPDESGTRRLDTVRRGVGQPRPRTARLRAARPPQPPPRATTLRRIAAAGGPVCCEVMTNVLHSLSLSALGRPSLTGDDRRADVRRGHGVCSGCSRTPRRSDGLRSRGRRSRRWRCRTCPSTSDAGSWRSTCSIRAASGCRCRRPRSRRPIRRSRLGTRTSSGCGATGAARRGSTRRGSCGSAWCGSATRLRPTELASRIAGAVRTNGLREYYHPYTGEGMGAFAIRLVDARDGDDRARSAGRAASYLEPATVRIRGLTSRRQSPAHCSRGRGGISVHRLSTSDGPRDGSQKTQRWTPARSKRSILAGSRIMPLE